jgi:hypothetical protein
MDFNFIWDKTIGGNNLDGACSLCVLGDELYISGGSNSNAGYEKTENAYDTLGNFYDSWFVGVSYDGEVLWDKTIGCTASETNPMMFCFNENDFIFLSGVYEASASHELSLNGYGDFDVWIYRMTIPMSSYALVNEIPEFDLYPNPSTSNLFVNLKEETNAIVSIYSMSGKIIETFNTSSDSFCLDVKNYQSGMYLMKINIGEGFITKRFVVK